MPSKPIKDRYYIIQIADNPDHSPNDSVNSTDGIDNSKIANCFQLNPLTLLEKQKIETVCHVQPGVQTKRKVDFFKTLTPF